MGWIVVETKAHMHQELTESVRVDTPSMHSSNKYQNGTQRRLQSAAIVPHAGTVGKYAITDRAPKPLRGCEAGGA